MNPRAEPDDRPEFVVYLNAMKINNPSSTVQRLPGTCFSEISQQRMRSWHLNRNGRRVADKPSRIYQILEQHVTPFPKLCAWMLEGNIEIFRPHGLLSVRTLRWGNSGSKPLRFTVVPGTHGKRLPTHMG